MSDCTWSNVKGVVYIDIIVDVDNKWYYDSKEVPASGVVPPGKYELEINFISSGYDDPGNPYGSIETCYAPYREDNRDLVDIYIYPEKSFDPISIPKELQEILFDHFYKEINK